MLSSILLPRSVRVLTALLLVGFFFAGCDTPEIANPPQGSIVAPVKGSTVGRMVRISVAAAADLLGDNKIEKVRVSANGAGIGEATRVSGSSTPTYEFIWDTSGLADGVYQVQAEITDSYGSRTLTEVSNVTVENGTGTGPRTAIANLTDGQAVAGTVNVEVIPMDGAAGLQGVALMLNGVQIAQDTTSPYVFAVNTQTLRVGLHSFQAKARNTNGAVRYSSAVTVNVTGG